MQSRRTATVLSLAGALTLGATAPSFAATPTPHPAPAEQASAAAQKGAAVPVGVLIDKLERLVRSGDVAAATAADVRPLLRKAAQAQNAHHTAARNAALSEARDRLNRAGLDQVDPFAEHQLQRQLLTWLDAPAGISALQATTRDLLENGGLSSRFAAQVQSRLKTGADDPGSVLPGLLRLIDGATSRQATRYAKGTLYKAAERLQLGATSSSTGITITITNNTGKDLTLTYEQKSTGDWSSHFPSSLPAGGTASGSATSNNINGQHLLADYTSTDGTKFEVEANVPLGGYNAVGWTISGPNRDLYTVTGSVGSGYHPTAPFTLKTR